MAPSTLFDHLPSSIAKLLPMNRDRTDAASTLDARRRSRAASAIDARRRSRANSTIGTRRRSKAPSSLDSSLDDPEQIAADEDHLECEGATHAAMFRVNSMGRRYPDDGPLPDVLPDKDDGEVLRQGSMNRKFIDTKGVSWVKHSLVLTKERLLIAKDGDPKREVFDDILLRDVIECELKEDEKNPDILEVIFRTNENGYNSGRSYIYMSEQQNSEDWEAVVDDAVANAKAKHHEDFMQFTYGHNPFAMFRARCKIVYEHTYFQYFFALMIMGGFIQDMLESQLIPDAYRLIGTSSASSTSSANSTSSTERRGKGGAAGDTGEVAAVGQHETPPEVQKLVFEFLVAQLFFCSVYTLEFLFNLFVNSENLFGEEGFFRKFSNWFDFSIVGISIVSVILSVIGLKGGPPLKMLRLLRVIRVIRLFRNFRALTRMCTSISFCIIPLANAMLILLMVTIFTSVLGFSLFAETYPDYFRDLDTAMFTMFQVVMGDLSTPRTLFEVQPDGSVLTNPAVSAFFVIFIIISNIILINVCVAVLLDEFVSATIRDKEAAERALEKENQKRRITGVLDPITTELQYFDSRENLVDRIDNMYTTLDEDGSGGLSFAEFKHGLLNLDDMSKIHMTMEDFDQITDNGRYLTDGEFNQSQFQDIMQQEFTRFCNRSVANSVKESKSTEFKTLVLMMKMMEMRLEVKVMALEESVTTALTQSENTLAGKFSEMEQKVLRLLERTRDVTSSSTKLYKVDDFFQDMPNSTCGNS